MAALRILITVGTLNEKSVLWPVANLLAERFRKLDCEVDLLNFSAEPLALFNVDTSYTQPGYSDLKQRVARADVIILATPDYHGSYSSVTKNFLDHFWHEFAGKLFVTLISSYEKGLTAADHLRTIARQCNAWTLPYNVSFTEKVDVIDGKVATDKFQAWLEILIRDTSVYGKLLAAQRQHDLAVNEACFMARHRK